MRISPDYVAGIAPASRTSEARPDTRLPTLDDLSIPSVIDVTDGTAIVSFGAFASDKGSGVSRVSLILDRPFYNAATGSSSSGIDLFDSLDPFRRDGFSARDISFGEASGAGTYHISGVYVTDKALNQTYYSAAQLQSAGIATSFEVRSDTRPDNKPPTLDDLSIPSVIDVTDGTAIVSFGAFASDKGSGVSRVSLILDRPFYNAATGSSSSGIDLFDSLDPFRRDGFSARDISFGEASGAGTYHISGVYVTDKALNQTYYSAAQLQSAGIATSFEVVDREAAFAGPSFDTTTIAPDHVLLHARTPEIFSDFML